MHPLLNKYANDPRLHLISVHLDETVFPRELAPLAGHYPVAENRTTVVVPRQPERHGALFRQVIETAGLYNTAGFNDDTRAFPSIPARHDTWRRASANWLAGLVLRGILTEEEAAEMSVDMAYRLPKQAYRLD